MYTQIKEHMYKYFLERTDKMYIDCLDRVFRDIGYYVKPKGIFAT